MRSGKNRFMLNQVTLMGNLTRDPETRSFGDSGNMLAKGGLAINKRFRSRDGELKETTTFVDFDVFGKQAENFAKYCRKGDSILLTGELNFEQWEDKTSHEKRSKLGVRARSIRFIRVKSFEKESAGAGADAAVEEDDSIPF